MEHCSELLRTVSDDLAAENGFASFKLWMPHRTARYNVVRVLKLLHGDEGGDLDVGSQDAGDYLQRAYATSIKKIRI